MFNTPDFLILAIVTTLLFLVILVLFNSVRSLSKKVRLTETNIASNELLVNQLQTLFITLDKSVKELNNQHTSENTELNQVTKQLEHRIKSIQEDINKLQQTQAQQPEDKLYSRAFKMVELGADVAELVRECDIPRAEAEMLISIHQKQSTT
jgi:septal ring factor EnvC (AmiA/AmiB activator)